MTQDQLARITRLNLTHIQRLERGVGNPSLATVYALADSFGMTLPEFFGYDEPFHDSGDLPAQ